MDKGGFVKLIETMPAQDLDQAIVNAARVSYAEGTKTVRSNDGLIRYLMRHHHNTPFEMVEFKFHIKMPIFIARQHMRHRTASINEMSARYSVVPHDYYFSEDSFRPQSTINRQSSIEDQHVIVDPNKVKNICESAFQVYDELLDGGCCREMARAHLPQSAFTEFYWKINLHNLMHYLQLRMEAGAQKEIREYAFAIYELIKDIVPITMDAFYDFRLNSMQLSASEINCIVTKSNNLKGGEKREFEEKLKILGITI